MNERVDRESLVCPGCRGRDATVLFEAYNGYPIVRCSACRLAFTDDRKAPSPEQLYPPFDQTTAPALDGIRRALAVFLRQREAFVRSVCTPPARLLDFGCGSGAFARWMSTRGYDVVGLEPFSFGGDPVTSERLTLIKAPLAEAGPKLGQFDVITMWHVLEHVHDPTQVLRGLASLLARGGTMIVSVPNFRSVQATVFRGRWFHLDPPRHVVQFEPETLADCLARAGFRVFEQRAFLPEYGTSGWLQSALNGFLPHHNYLYELVKDRGALRGMNRVASALHLTASVLAAPPILAAAMVLEAAASRGNRTAALTVAARAA